jgi:hypothetical protein
MTTVNYLTNLTTNYRLSLLLINFGIGPEHYMANYPFYRRYCKQTSS